MLTHMFARGTNVRSVPEARSSRFSQMIVLGGVLALSGWGCLPPGEDTASDAGPPPPAGTGGAIAAGGHGGGVTVGSGGGAAATGGGTANGTGGAIVGSGGSNPGSGGASSGGASTGGAGGAGTGGAGTGGTGTGGRGGATTGVGGTGTGGTGTAGTGAGGAVEIPPVAACATNQMFMCTGTTEIACHFGGTPGNYEVTVELGGAAAGNTMIEAEAFRRMLPALATTAGQTRRFSFVTNVRVYENEPVRPDQSGTSKGIAGLDVYFRGTTPKMTSICFAPAAKPLMIWIAGDSTVTDQASQPFAGWGQHLPQHFVSPISVANYADSGESSASFVGNAKLWGAIKAGMKAGDWVMIQLGHNDKTISATAFQSNLTRMLTDAKAASVNAILITPISRGPGTGTQHVSSAGANLPQIIRDLGKSQNVPVIDLTAITAAWMQTVRWQDYYVSGDATHTNALGADIFSGFVKDAVKAQGLDLARYLRN